MTASQRYFQMPFRLDSNWLMTSSIPTLSAGCAPAVGGAARLNRVGSIEPPPAAHGRTSLALEPDQASPIGGAKTSRERLLSAHEAARAGSHAWEERR